MSRLCRVRLLILGGWFVCSVVCPGGTVSAEPSVTELVTRMEQMEQRIQELETRLAVYEDTAQVTERRLSRVEETPPQTIDARAGMEIGVGATFVAQGTDKVNGDDLSRNGEDVADTSYSVDLELTRAFDAYGRVLLLLEAGQGAGVEDELKVFSNVNYDATGGDANLGVVEGWYEQYLGPVTVRFGKLDATYLIDGNAYANDECTQFLGRIFRNNPAVEFADNGAGVRLAVALNEFFDLESLVMDGDGDWEDFFEDTFYAGQVTVRPGFFDHPGQYRLYGWGSDREHTRWDDAAQTKENTYGFGLSFDQALTESLGVFARYGWQNPEVFLNGESVSLEQSYSVGVQVSGSPWSREDDVIGVAFGGVIPSDDYKKSGGMVQADTEYHLEAYYSYRVNEHLSLSPDIQVIWNPYGGDAVNGDTTVVVGGIRSQIDF